MIFYAIFMFINSTYIFVIFLRGISPALKQNEIIVMSKTNSYE